VSIRLEIRGGELDGDAPAPRVYKLELQAQHAWRPVERADLEPLVKAWYLVAFNSGFGHPLNELGEFAYDSERDQRTVTFRVVGWLTEQSLQVLLRCLENPDLDVLVETVVVDISAWNAS
jgi:hypothetical protein